MWEMRLRWASPVVKKTKQTNPACQCRRHGFYHPREIYLVSPSPGVSFRRNETAFSYLYAPFFTGAGPASVSSFLLGNLLLAQ